MSDTSIDEVVSEQAFAALLGPNAEMFYRLANSLLVVLDADWTRRHLYQLVIEADSLEALLDDHGARHNRSFHLLRELVASVRGLAAAAFSLSHLERRLASYNTNLQLYPEREQECRRELKRALTLVRHNIHSLLEACLAEGRRLGVELPGGGFPQERFEASELRKKLPRNLGEELLEDEEQRIAEVASKYIQVCDMFQRLGARPVDDPAERERFLASHCSEERARVYEATVHNLQSAYDTYIKNTVLESSDPRLGRLRGHASAAFHMLEAVTQLVHFVERHESAAGEESAGTRIAEVVDRRQIREVTLDILLCWASEFMVLGRPIAEELLPAYTNVQELAVELPQDMYLHARPAALIVGIVQRYGTPVELEIGETRCDASSILDMLITVGSNSDARNLVFRGDENPLRDIGLLFDCGLGERGDGDLPDSLSYLRG